ncbi:MAG: metal-dependent phosphohydrolase, partial [Pirellulaceae bacterium]
SDKGRTADELMVFARYVMFSEVYWHHAVRSGTAMLQRAFFEVSTSLAPGDLCELTDDSFIETLTAAAGADIFQLVTGLFGTTRVLYKRLLQFSHFQEDALY